MKVLISVDMEGITGVVSQSHTDHTTAEYQRFRRLMTGDANAAIEGALAGGATDIVVNDSHGNMDNILIEELNPAARLISGSPKPFSMMEGIGPDVDAAIFIGYHARAGSAPAVHDHTWSSMQVYAATLNGKPMGEIMLNAALAGHFSVPVMLVTGDQLATAEARDLLGDVETATVKIAVAAAQRTACRRPRPRPSSGKRPNRRRRRRWNASGRRSLSGRPLRWGLSSSAAFKLNAQS